MSNPIYVSIDTTDVSVAQNLAHGLSQNVGGIKLGLEFFVAQGPAGIRQVARGGLPLFLDLKLHDIPNTVAGAMRGVVDLTPDIVTVHASGGAQMIRAAVDAAYTEAEKLNVKPPRIIAVTVLTSLDQNALTQMGIQRPVVDQVVALAQMAVEAGADGVVCSPHEVAAIRAALGPKPLLVVPGIRPAGAAADDQKRVMTPAQALTAGADILVIGRPITQSPDPVAAAQAILKELPT